MYFENQAHRAKTSGHCFRMSINNYLQMNLLSGIYMRDIIDYVREKTPRNGMKRKEVGHKILGWYHTNTIHIALKTKGYALKRLSVGLVHRVRGSVDRSRKFLGHDWLDASRHPGLDASFGRRHPALDISP